MMGIGAESPFWRRALLRAFAFIYFRRRIRTTHGIFDAYVSPNSGLKVLSVRGASIDPVHQRFIRDWIDPDAVVWDIGSNLGLFAFAAALKATRGHVFAFEPDVELSANLLRSLRLPQNKRLNVSILSVAISNVNGAAAFQISKFSRALSRLVGVGKCRDRVVVTDELRSVVTMRMDTLSQTLSAPSVVKIDVEGAEMLVLEGGEETISKYRPVILIEGPRELRSQMCTFFEKHDYVLLDGATDHQHPLREPVWDTFAVPRENFTRVRVV
jgi:FkbM family methyltransferase